MLEVMFKNRVYTWQEKKYRLLDNFGDFGVFIDINDPGAFPFKKTADEIAKIDSETTILGIEDPWSERINRVYKPGHKHLMMRDENLKRIEKLITGLEYWDRRELTDRITVLVNLKVGAKSTFYRYSRRYWQRGQTPNTLLPDYPNSGGKGKRKSRQNGKLGRTQEYGDYELEQMTPELESMMRKAIKLTVLNGKYTVDKKGKPKNVFNLNDTYTELLTLYCEGDVSKLDKSKPSKDLLRAYYYQKYTPEARANAKYGHKHFKSNISKLASSVSENLVGPGYSYEIDATPFDAGVADDERFPLGRPTLYEVVDGDTSAITGFLLTLTPPSYFNAMNAMVASVRNKVELCKEFGMDIEHEDWPMEGLPKAFFGDLGSDFKSKKITSVTVNNGVAFINSGASQPEKRSKVERTFGRLYKEVKSKIPGLISSYLPKKHGGKYNPEDYTLLLSELNKILLRYTMVLNSETMGVGKVRSDYPAELDTSPNSKWKWGISHRTGPLHSTDTEQFWYSLLERHTATVSKQHILTVKGLKYDIPDRPGLRTKIFNNRQKEQVAIDQSDASHIYLVPEDGESKYIKCPLTSEFRRFKGLTWVDAIALKQSTKHANANATHETEKRKVKASIETKEEVQAAVRDKAEKSKDRSKQDELSRLGNKETQREQSKEIYNAVKPKSARTPSTEYEIQDTATQTYHVARSRLNQFFMDDED